MNIKSIIVSVEVHKRLTKLGTYGDSMSDIIENLLDEHDSHKEQKKEIIAE